MPIPSKLKGSMRASVGKLDEAQQVLDQVLSTRSQFPAKDATRYLALASLSGVYIARGHLPRAIEFFRKALIEGETVQGGEHQIILAYPAIAIARDCEAVQRWKEAEDAVEKALLVWRAQQTSPA